MNKSKSFAPTNLFAKPSTEDPTAVDIYLYGAIPDVDWNTWELVNTDNEFIEQFKEAERQYDRINIHINSPGGVITDGLVMFNTIRSSKKEVHTYNDGLAASMGSIILAAGHTVHAPETSIVMLHTAIGGIVGNKEQIRDYADSLEVYEQVIIAAIAKKTKKSTDEILDQFFDGKDHFMTGKDAYELGLVDELEDYEPALPEGAQNMTYDQIVNHYSTDKSSNVMNLKDFFSGKAKAEKNTVEVSSEELEKLRTASEEAVNQYEQLETNHAATQKQLETALQARVDAEDALDAEKKAHEATNEAFEAYKKESAEHHTFVNKDGDDYQGGTKERADYQKKEDEVRERAASAVKTNTQESSK